MKTGRPLILSASRRTDLPGFHAQICADRIRLRIARLRTRCLAGVVFWSKHVDAFLKGGVLHQLVKEELENPVLNLTVTGLGKSKLEPGGPPTAHILAKLPELIDVFHREPWRIRWRFDPLLKKHSSLSTFAKIGSVMAEHGVPTCTFSFPAYRSLKGDLTDQFEKAGIPRWELDEKRDFLSGMAQIAKEFGISLYSCSQPQSTELEQFVESAQCIPFDVLSRGFSAERLMVLGKDFSQRTHCKCIESEDIGDYEKDPCHSGCVYCYSKASR